MFRPARAEEATALRHLEKAANLVALAHVFPPETCPYPDQIVLDRWRGLLADPAMTTVVSEDGQGLTAFASFDETTLLHLGVRPDRSRWWSSTSCPRTSGAASAGRRRGE